MMLNSGVSRLDLVYQGREKPRIVLFGCVCLRGSLIIIGEVIEVDRFEFVFSFTSLLCGTVSQLSADVSMMSCQETHTHQEQINQCVQLCVCADDD